MILHVRPSHQTERKDILQQLSESSCADWSRAMLYERIYHGNDVTCHAVPVVLFLVFRKKKNVIVKNKSTTIFHGLRSHRP